MKKTEVELAILDVFANLVVTYLDNPSKMQEECVTAMKELRQILVPEYMQQIESPVPISFKLTPGTSYSIKLRTA
ncbi:MAG TPA: hypothetical protein VGE15_12985 [Sphingobacteriaceae bacterium]